MNLNVTLRIKHLFKFFRKKKKENLLIGSLLLVSAIFSLLPGLTHLFIGFSSLSLSLYTLDEFISIGVFSLLLLLPSLILVSNAYLIWEGHSLGWKLSIGICGVAILMAISNSSFVYFALPIAVLSGLASVFEILSLRKTKNQTKDSPVITENLAKLGLRLSAIISISVLISMLIFIIIEASPFLTLQFFTSMNLNSANVARICYSLPPVGSVGGVLSCVIGSALIVTFCEFVAVPIGIGAAIYLAEYSSQNKFTNTLRFFIETLAGAPSVIIGIVGYSVFTLTLHWGYSLYSGAIALSFMALPWNIRIAEEAIRAVPRSYREASFALGATQWQTARKTMLYAAWPGIITGVLLGIGVVLGETLVLVMNFSGFLLIGLPAPWTRIFNLGQQLPALTTFIYQVPGSVLINQGHLFAGGNSSHAIFLSYSLSLAAATVLISIYLVLCIGALLLRNYLNKRMSGT